MAPVDIFDRAPKISAEETPKVFRVECHFECHCTGKIRKQKQNEEGGRKNPMTLNRWKREAYRKEPVFIEVSEGCG